MKTFSLIIASFLFIGAKSQNQPGIATDNRSVRTKTSIHEIEYQFPYMLGYSYFHNFNNTFVPGIGAKFGVGFNFEIPRSSDWQMWEFDLKAMNLFARKKINRKLDYHLGLNYSYFFFDTPYNFYGIKISAHYKPIKFIGIGISTKIGIKAYESGTLSYPFWNPYVSIHF
jgi:hypothetical protein